MQEERFFTCYVGDGRSGNNYLLARVVDVLWTCILRQKNYTDDKLQHTGRQKTWLEHLGEVWLIWIAHLSVASSLIS